MFQDVGERSENRCREPSVSVYTKHGRLYGTLINTGTIRVLQFQSCHKLISKLFMLTGNYEMTRCVITCFDLFRLQAKFAQAAAEQFKAYARDDPIITHNLNYLVVVYHTFMSWTSIYRRLLIHDVFCIFWITGLFVVIWTTEYMQHFYNLHCLQLTLPWLHSSQPSIRSIDLWLGKAMSVSRKRITEEQSGSTPRPLIRTQQTTPSSPTAADATWFLSFSYS